MPDCFLASKHNQNKALAVCVCACEPLCTYVPGCPRAGQSDAEGDGCRIQATQRETKGRDVQAARGQNNPLTFLTCTVRPAINLCLTYDSATSKDFILSDGPQLLMASLENRSRAKWKCSLQTDSD